MIIVTGGAGFIGSVLLAHLNSQGISNILVVDALDSSIKWKNLVNKRIVDLLDLERFRLALEKDSLPKVQAVIHLGACTSTTETDAHYMIETNYQASRTLADWALNKNIRFIYASSAATYGDGSLGFSDTEESSLGLMPLNIYAYSKQLFDMWAIQTGAISKMVGLKFFNVYGPNEYHKRDMSSVVLKSFHQVQEDNRIRLFKSYHPNYPHGGQKRDFIYVKDCTDVIFWFLNNDRVGIYNLGTGHARTWNDLATAVFRSLGKEPVIEYIEMPPSLQNSYQYFTQARMEKLRAAGYTKPFTSLEDGVKDYVQNYLWKDNAHY